MCVGSHREDVLSPPIQASLYSEVSGQVSGVEISSQVGGADTSGKVSCVETSGHVSSVHSSHGL